MTPYPDYVICLLVLRVLFSPVRMIMVPPRHYCVILNPAARDDEGQVLFDQSGQAKLRHADLEIRLTQDPFQLYPGEEIQQVCQNSFFFSSFFNLRKFFVILMRCFRALFTNILNLWP